MRVLSLGVKIFFCKYLSGVEGVFIISDLEIIVVWVLNYKLFFYSCYLFVFKFGGNFKS